MLYRIRDEKPIPIIIPDSKDPRRLELQYATFGPEGSALAFIHRFVFMTVRYTYYWSRTFIVVEISENIYYQESVESVPKKIATSTDERTIMNGIPDWLYEEEILSKESAIWFSPGGTRLLYASFNDTGVDETVYPLYGNYEDNLNTSPEMMSVRYPKVCSICAASNCFKRSVYPVNVPKKRNPSNIDIQLLFSREIFWETANINNFLWGLYSTHTLLWNLFSSFLFTNEISSINSFEIVDFYSLGDQILKWPFM